MVQFSRINFGFQIRYAFRNLRRHPRRTMLTGSAVALSAAILCFMFSYFNGVLYGFLNRYARLESGHLRLVHSEYRKKETLLPLDLSISGADSLCGLIAKRSEVSGATQRIRFGALASSGEHSVPVAGLGLDFKAEKQFLDPEKSLTAGRLPESEEEIVIGYLLAQRLGLSIGDTLLLLGQDSHRSLSAAEFRIAGLISLGMNPVDRRAVYLPLESARAFTDLPDGATEILILLHDPNEDQAAKASLERDLAPGDQNLVILGWRDQESMFRMLASSKAVVNIFILYFLAIAASTIVNTILMAVLERGREIGMLKALGMSRTQVAGLFILEGGFIGALFTPVGAAVGGLVAGYTEKVGIPIGKVGQTLSIPFGNLIYPDFRWEYFGQAVIFALLMSLIASLYPAWKAGRINSAEVLRTHH